jgi:uncharacterized protein YkwD
MLNLEVRNGGVTKMKKIIILPTLLVIALFGVSSCTPSVSQQEYDRVSNALNAVQEQLELLQGKLAEAESQLAVYEELTKQQVIAKSELETIQAKYEELSTEHEELNEQFDAVKMEAESLKENYEALSTEYNELNNKYEELQKHSDNTTEEPSEINEGDIEQALFALVNQERIDNGLDELMWGNYRYKEAIAHSQYMATTKKLEYPEYGWQEIFWATGYSTADEVANAAFTVWKNRQQYEIAFLNKVTLYGAVAVYKLGDIFYITYLADYFQ